MENIPTTYIVIITIAALFSISCVVLVIYFIYNEVNGSYQKIHLEYKGNKYKVLFKSKFYFDYAHVYENGKKIGVSSKYLGFNELTDFRFHAINSIEDVIRKNETIQESKRKFDLECWEEKIKEKEREDKP